MMYYFVGEYDGDLDEFYLYDFRHEYFEVQELFHEMIKDTAKFPLSKNAFYFMGKLNSYDYDRNYLEKLDELAYTSTDVNPLQEEFLLEFYDSLNSMNMIVDFTHQDMEDAFDEAGLRRNDKLSFNAQSKRQALADYCKNYLK